MTQYAFIIFISYFFSGACAISYSRWLPWQQYFYLLVSQQVKLHLLCDCLFIYFISFSLLLIIQHHLFNIGCGFVKTYVSIRGLGTAKGPHVALSHFTSNSWSGEKMAIVVCPRCLRSVHTQVEPENSWCLFPLKLAVKVSKATWISFEFFFSRLNRCSTFGPITTLQSVFPRQNSAISGQMGGKYLTQGRGRYGGWRFIRKQGYRSPKVSLTGRITRH